MIRWVFMLLLCGGCVEPAEFECRVSEDCAEATCIGGRCHPAIQLADRTDAGALTDAEGGGKADFVDEQALRGCRDGVIADASNLIVNEVLANVPSGPAGDANGDGERHPFEDEFVELVNVSSEPVDVTGVRISNNGVLKFVFEPLCVRPGLSVTVFGGGQVSAAVAGAAVTSDVRFALSNDGGVVGVSGRAGVIDSVRYAPASQGSVTRSPDLVGEQFVSHQTVSDLPFSPGRCADGTPIDGPCGVAGNEPDMGITSDAEN